MNNNNKSKPKQVQMPVSNTSAKKTKRRKRKTKNNDPNGNVVSVYPYASYTNNNPRTMVKVSKKRITPSGEAFLKCAFAPPDFAINNPTGVPDEYQGLSLLKKHRFVGTFNCSSANTDYYILLVPAVGGIAYHTTSVTAGTPILSSTVWTANFYSDASSLFPSSSGMADVVDKYRFVSNHIELIPTMNQFNWAGSIQAWKMPVAMVLRNDGVNPNVSGYTVTGLNGANATNVNQYTGPMNLGVYTAAYNSGNGFDFANVAESINQLPSTRQTGDFGTLGGPLGGIDSNFESVCIKLSGMGATTTNSFILKTWCCIEYLPVPGSSVYEYQTMSPQDKYALELYRAVILQLPIGVSFLENEGFWKRVLDIVKRVSGSLSMAPGPYGAVATGVNMISQGIEELVF